MNWDLVNRMVLKEEGTFDDDPIRSLDKIEKAHKFKVKCCSEHRGCHKCPYASINNGRGTPCMDLTIGEVLDIYNKLNKEDKTMTKKEEIQQEIEKTQKQLAALQEKLKEAEDDVPDILSFDSGDDMFVVGINGKINEFTFSDSKEWDHPMCKVHRAFKSKNYAKIFADSTQLIADQLHFKWLYDRDYKPNWRSGEGKHIVIFDYVSGRFCENFEVSCGASAVQFSTKELAKRCADWLNKKYGYTKE